MFEPTILISDASNAIRNAFAKNFDAKKMIMCYIHVKRNVAKRPLKDNKNRKRILNDMTHMASSEENFKIMSQLFLKKYKESEPEFVDYFQSQWLGEHCNWYEAAAVYTPSTNNNLEGEHYFLCVAT